MNRVILVATACALLAGCETNPVLPGRTAIPVACKEPVPDRPVMATDNLPADSKVDPYVAAAASELKEREAYEIKLRGSLIECTRPIEAAPS